MEPATNLERAPKRVSGRGKHLYRARRKAAPRQWRGKRAPLGHCADRLFPWDIYDYPGVVAGLAELCAGRASVHAVRDWIRGRRKAPQWVWHLIAIEAERRASAFLHVAELAKKEAGL
jgi:hypothetical protein